MAGDELLVFLFEAMVVVVSMVEYVQVELIKEPRYERPLDQRDAHLVLLAPPESLAPSVHFLAAESLVLKAHLREVSDYLPSPVKTGPVV